MSPTDGTSEELLLDPDVLVEAILSEHRSSGIEFVLELESFEREGDKKVRFVTFIRDARGYRKDDENLIEQLFAESLTKNGLEVSSDRLKIMRRSFVNATLSNE